MKKLCMLFVSLLLLSAAASADSFTAVWGDGGAPFDLYRYILLEDEAPVVTLMPAEPVTDLVLTMFSFESEETSACVIWSAEQLAPWQVIHLQGWLGEVMPRFRLRWTDADGRRQSRYLFESGEDGSLLLSEALDLDELLQPAWQGLAETEAESSRLLAYLAEDHTAEELEEAAALLYNLWDDQRIALWGSYAMSPAETSWEVSRWSSLYDACRFYAGTRLYSTMVSALGAEMTRRHVYALMDLEPPAIPEPVG